MTRSDTDLLLSFLAGRDVPCPRCGYNLRDLAVPVCPECRKELALDVCLRSPEIVWLVAAVTPGLFSGLCALLLLVPITASSLNGFPPPWPLWGAEAFGWMSCLGALVALWGRQWFLRRPLRGQRLTAVAVWCVHVAAFALLLLALALYA